MCNGIVSRKVYSDLNNKPMIPLNKYIFTEEGKETKPISKHTTINQSTLGSVYFFIFR